MRQAAVLESRLRLGAWALRLAFLPLVAVAAAAGDVTEALVTAGVLLITLIPVVLERVLQRRFDAAIHLAVAAGLLAEMAGRTLDLYEGHPIPYDILAHAVEVGALVAVVLHGLLRAALRNASWPTVIAVATALALLIGLSWEVVEAVLDSRMPTTLQHGLDDTLLDVLAGAAGGAVVGALLPLYWSVGAGPSGRLTPPASRAG